MTRRGVFALALSAFAALGNAMPAMAFFRGGGGGASGGVTLLTTQTLQNPGSTDTNVELRFGQAFPRGAVATTGYTFVLKDDLSNTLAMQYDARSDYNGQAGSTEGAWIRHVVFSTIVPTFGSARTISIYKQAGSYSPGTPIALSTITGSHNFTDKFGNSTYPATDCNGNTIGSGQFQFLFNTYAAITFGPNGSGTGIPGGIRQLSSGAVQSTWLVTGAMTDLVGGAPYAHMYAECYATSWSNGRVEVMPRLSNPWKNITTPTPTLYWGDRTFYDGATVLRSWTQNFTFAPSAVSLTNTTFLTASGASTGVCSGTTAFTVSAGSPFNNTMIGQYLYISTAGTGLTIGNYLITAYTSGTSITLATSPGTGTGASWRIGGGAIANLGTIQAGEPFVFSSTGTLPSPLVSGELTFVMANAFGVMGLTTHPAGISVEGQGYITLASQGTGTHTMTRTCTVNSWQGNYLPADDAGNPHFLPARIATPYPNLTSAEKLYWMETGMVPPFNTTAPSNGSFPANYFTFGGGSGPAYRPNSLGLEIPSITQGGYHNGIGWWSDWSAAWWMNQSTTNWDQLRATALSQTHMPMGNLLNALTGYQPAFDNGPDQVGGSYVGVGAPFPSDCLYFYNPVIQGFVEPATPTAFGGVLARAVAWWGGIGFNDTDEGGMTDHHPEFSMIPQYLMEGKPWFLDQIRRDANYGLATALANPYNGISDRTMTITGATPANQYAKFFWMGEQPRTTAWGIRAPSYAAVLGANTDPEQIMWWSILRQNIRQVHLIDTVFYSGASSGFGGTGFQSTTEYDSMFMDNYMALAASCMYGMIRQDESAVVPGASMLYLLNRCLRLPIGLMASWGISNYWASSERVSDMGPFSSLGTAPGATFATSLAAVGVYYGPLTFDTGGVPTDASGVITVNGWSATDDVSQYYGNNDQWIPMNAAAVTAFGDGIASPLYVVNWTPGSPPTCQLSNTIGGSPIVPPAAATGLYFGPRPVANPATPKAQKGANISPQGYQAEYVGGFSAALAVGCTEPNLAAALTAALTRYNPTTQPGAFANAPWCLFYMDPTIVVH